jgi:hypothetical protein
MEDKMLQREWSGRRVELLCGLRTKGGIEFKAGEVLVSGSAYRGMLNLHDPATMKGNLITRAINRVSKHDVRLLPLDARGVEVRDGR